MEERQSVFDELFGGAPLFVRRGFMLDVSRDRVPRLDTLAWLIDVLSAMRFNELQLYIEHTFAYTGHDVVWANADPYTHADIAWIRDRAAAAGIRLVPNVNGFGHMERWLKHDAYRDRAECPDGAPALLGDGLMPPTCLEPTPENAEFAVALAREMRSVIGGSTVMIGGDEPFELGRCRSADRADSIGQGELYRQHLGRIMSPLLADGLEVLFWGDQFRTDPRSVAWIPDGATCVVWNYEAPAADPAGSGRFPQALLDVLDMPDDSHIGCLAHARLLIDAGRPFQVACGTSSWNTLVGRNRNAAGNIEDTVAVGVEHGAEGILVTDWGDNGHHHPLAVSLPSIVRAGVAAWTGRLPAAGAVGPIIDQLLDAAPGTGELLDRVGHVGETLGLRTINGSPICDALIRLPFPTSGTADPAALAAACELIDDAVSHFDRSLPDSPRGRLIAAELMAINRLAGLGLRRLVGDEPSTAEFDEVLAAQREAWLGTSRPGGLEDSLAIVRRPQG